MNVPIKSLISDYSFLLDLVQLLTTNHVIPETILRNYKIKLDYLKLIDEESSAKEAREILADRYFLSDKCIQTIIYNKRSKNIFTQ